MKETKSFSKRASAWWLLVAAFVLGKANLVIAGLAPENVIVVVNANDENSRTVANHYVELRSIPSANVIFLDEVPKSEVCSADEFGQRILEPILETLDSRRLTTQARVIAYSSGFPFGVALKELHSQLPEGDIKKYQRPRGSLTGMTCLFTYFRAGSPALFGLEANVLARGLFRRNFANPYNTGPASDNFTSAEKLRADGKMPEAAEAYADLFSEDPAQAPLAIRAAQCFALAEQSDKAIQWILRSVTAGWKSGSYLRNAPEFSEVLENPIIANLLSKLDDRPAVYQLPIETRSTTRIAFNGWPTKREGYGVPILLSCQLAMIHERGNTLAQAIKNLTRSSQCDETQPKGRFVFAKTGDVRTKTRVSQFADGLVLITSAGHKAEIDKNIFPTTPGAVAGLAMGSPKFLIENRIWDFVPGAIADNLTSFGAKFSTNSQTKMTDLLAAGVAMTSGPVEEPYTIPTKFPNISTYGHYAFGSTAIEAFVGGIASPYQTLIVGDPLAAAFINKPDALIRVAGDAASNRLAMQFEPDNESEKPGVAGFEIYLDGRLVLPNHRQSKLNLNLKGIAPGMHQIRIVTVGDDANRSRESEGGWLQFGEAAQTVSINSDGSTIKVEADGADQIELRHHNETIGKMESDQWTVDVSQYSLGSGPVRVRAVAKFDDVQVVSRDIIATVD